ncbi:ATP-dependent RNA helicase DDX1-like isoform X2 [Corticium candelabrum]|uniref:ATP-dependent RNA helicase DDX1-like isoform X2 n=1 Tax=Corticium candelabrum TaxID=121492 RepID=UPI002E25F492|nr:ATP-dependent RNA helicase DDX1-like isoform X2 [Corticium candelabrum]
MAAFTEFGVLPEIVKAVEEMGWTLPTDVQAEAVPLILGGGDVLMAAETGSGKTGAFSLPVIQIVYETLREKRQGGMKKVSAGLSGWKMNFLDRDPEVAISEDGLLCQCREHRAWQGCRSTQGVAKSGRYYYETVVTDEGLCRVGWATLKAGRELGKDKQSFGFGGTGKKSYGSQFDDYGESFGINDTIGCYLDLNNREISFSKNGKDLGRAFEVPLHLKDLGFFAAVTLKNAEMKFNFGDSPFQYPPKNGFVPLNKADRQYVVSGSTGAAQFDPKKHSPSAIIIETNDNIVSFKKYLPPPAIKELLSVGGQPVKEQIAALSMGVDIVTGTPGRLDDLISTNHLDLSQVRFFVLDEADGLLSQGHSELINRIYQQIPKLGWDGKRLQMIVCSATLHSLDVKRLAEKCMHFPMWIDLKGQDSVPETVHHVVVWVDPTKDTSWQGLKHSVVTDGVHRHDKVKPGSQSNETLSESIKLLKAEYTLKAIEEHKMDQALIFCRTKLDCDNLEHYLLSKGGGPKALVNKYSCVCLHSDRAAAQRKANLQAFKDGEVRFLICTDVAARGIDVRGIPFVINVTLPDERVNYVHRIGRVGRAERMGLAISLVATVQEKVWYHSCPSRGKNCNNTRLKSDGGCTIWYNEKQYLADVENHLGESITAVENDIIVPVNEFDGKVVYGEKRGNKGSSYEAHTEQLAPSVQELAVLERLAQTSFLCRRHGKGMY